MNTWIRKTITTVLAVLVLGGALWLDRWAVNRFFEPIIGKPWGDQAVLMVLGTLFGLISAALSVALLFVVGMIIGVTWNTIDEKLQALGRWWSTRKSRGQVVPLGSVLTGRYVWNDGHWGFVDTMPKAKKRRSR